MELASPEFNDALISSNLFVIDKTGMGQTWEHRIAFGLPRMYGLSVLLPFVSISIGYVSIQWLLGFDIEPSAFGLGVFLTAILVAPAYFYRLYAPYQDEIEIESFDIARSLIQHSRFAGVAGVITFGGLWELIQVAQGREFLSLWTILYPGSSIAAMFLWMGWLVGRGGYFLFVGVWDIPVPHRSEIDLLDLEKIYVIGRSGLEGALLWFIVVAIAGVLIIPEVRSGLWLVVLIFAINVAGGLTLLLAPARKIRNLIRAAKREELSRLEPVLRQVRDDTLMGDAAINGRLSDLFVYKSRIESVPEWSFDPTTLIRFGLYLLIPVGSMVGGALVERLVDLVLERSL